MAKLEMVVIIDASLIVAAFKAGQESVILATEDFKELEKELNINKIKI